MSETKQTTNKSGLQFMLNSNAPLYKQIQQMLENRISEMNVGDKLPTEMKLAEELGVDRLTVRRAMVNLEKEGYLVRHRRRGTFVKKTFKIGQKTSPLAKTVALVIPDIEIPFNAKILKGVEEEARNEGYGVLVCNSLLSNEREGEILDWLKGQPINGILLVSFHTDSFNKHRVKQLRILQEQGKRIVLIDQYIAHLNLPVVMTHRMKMGYMMTEHLIMLGHEKICFANPTSYDTNGKATFIGYKRALKDYGIEIDENILIDIPVMESAEPAYQRVKAILSANPDAFTAFASPVLSMTYGAYRAIRELGLKVPDDIAMVGGDLDQNPELEKVITYVRQPLIEMGRRAFKLLVSEDKHQLKQHELLAPELIIRKSCGAGSFNIEN